MSHASTASWLFLTHTHELSDKGPVEVTITVRRGPDALDYYLFRRRFTLTTQNRPETIHKIEALVTKMRLRAACAPWSPSAEHWERIEQIDEAAPAQSRDDMPF